MTKKIVGAIGMMALLGMFASNAQAVPVYFSAPTDAEGNITLITGDTVTVDMFLNLSDPSFTEPNPITLFGFNIEIDGSGLTHDLRPSLITPNALYMASPFGLMDTEYEFLSATGDVAYTRDPGTGSLLPDVLLASFELIASEVGSFTFDVNGGIYFGEPIAALFDVGSELTINVVPEPGTWMLLATGLLGMMYWARRKSLKEGQVES